VFHKAPNDANIHSFQTSQNKPNKREGMFSKANKVTPYHPPVLSGFDKKGDFQ
jgi:hypothetical protein